MGRRVPPFAAIRAFEAAARQGNLQDAAEELGVSASAVSHQIKSLEEHLGARLFLRNNSRLSLTELGAAYQRELRQALDLIEIATARASQRQQGGRVTVNLFFSLAELWLIPLLVRFHKLHPDIEVRLVTQPEEATLAGSDIDIAIRYAPTDALDTGYEFLFEEDIVPVCSPNYIEEVGSLRTPADLAERRLVFCSLDPSEWSLWANTNGASLANVDHWLELDQRTFVIQAARKGIGIAMARRPYADADLEEGSLVTPYPNGVKTGFSYFLVTPERSRNLTQVKAFRNWLVDYCQTQMQMTPSS